MSSMTTAEMLLYSTMKVTTFEGGVASGSGTGFLYAIRSGESDSIPLLITNKHVLEGADAFAVAFHLKDSRASTEPNGKFWSLRVAFGDADVVMHPDPTIDLCAIPVGGLMNQLADQGKFVFEVSLDESLLPSDGQWDDFDAIEDVLMIGCPRGIYDEANNLPIVRRGTTASSLTKRYNGKDEFLVDMACFPGSSGSPVVLYSTAGYLDKRSKTFRMGATRLYLLGILYSGPLVTNSGKIVLGHLPSVEVTTMMHLGYVIRSSILKQLANIIIAKYGLLPPSIPVISANEGTERQRSDPRPAPAPLV